MLKLFLLLILLAFIIFFTYKLVKFLILVNIMRIHVKQEYAPKNHKISTRD